MIIKIIYESIKQKKVILGGVFFVLAVMMLMLFLIFTDRFPNGQDNTVFLNDKKLVGEVKGGKEADSQGSATLSDGSIYVGEFKDGVANGKGTIKYPNGIIYEGEMANGKPHGLGTITYTGGAKQVGEFKDGLANGKGTKMLPDGTIFSGTWKGGKRHGEFVETTPEGEHRVGYWRHGKYIGEEKPAALKSCEAECAEMFKKGELKKGMNLESCVQVLCGD